ncbi:MAG: AzlD domain-containing protein [Asgard group archaeon]|jgi:branched-subunit amino acid transport protein|nr:AzlD domain-containing protein [Asgard group archaeon]
MNEIEMFSTITIIGIFTLLIRSIFIYYLPEFMSSEKIKRGMSTVPASMLVSLVIPFTFFIDQQFIFNRPEVYAIIISIPLIHFSKRYSYGLIIAMICYFIIDFFLS